MIRVLVILWFVSLTGFYFLPFRTPIPGFTTFTLGKLAALALVVAATLSGALRLSSRSVRIYAPLLALAAWLPLSAIVHPVTPLADAKLLLGHTLAAIAGLVAAVALADPAFRRRVVMVVLVAGIVPIVAALTEPFTPPAADVFWRVFRPTPEATVHWHWGGIYRVCGIFSSPPELANFLVGWFPLAAAGIAAGAGLLLRSRVPVLIAALAGAVVFTLTLTRSSLLGTGVGAAAALLLLVAFGRPRPGARRHRRSPAMIPAALGAAVLAASPVLLQIMGRLTALSLGLWVGVAIVLLGIGAALAARDRRARIPAPAARWIAALALAVVLVPLIGFGRLAPAARTSVAGAWHPEDRHPDTAAERLVETAAHAGWQRQKLWRVAAWMLPAAPVAGPGWYAYAKTVHEDPSMKARFDLDAVRGDIDAGVDNPHNLYLTALTTGGVIALGLLLHVLLVLVRTALRGALDVRRSAFDRALAAAQLWYWCAFIAMGLVGQEVFTINGALSFHAWAALTLAPAMGDSKRRFRGRRNARRAH